MTATRPKPTSKYVTSISFVHDFYNLHDQIPRPKTSVKNNWQNSFQYNNTPDEHKAKISHELIGGAAAYEVRKRPFFWFSPSTPIFSSPSPLNLLTSFQAAKAYENHCRENGKPESHAEAKEILAGFAGAFIDREFETRGLGFMDREKAKHHARKTLDENVLSNEY